MASSTDFHRFEAQSRRSTVFSSKGVVACSQPLASAAGLRILQSGGNCADAAVAMVACLNVCEPVNTGIGGDLFALFWDAKARKVCAVNGSGRSPTALSLSKAQELGLKDRIPYESPHAVTVPGAAAGLVDIHGTWGSGKLSLSEVLAPAISLSKDGFPVHQMASYEWTSFEARLQAVAEEAQSGGAERYPFLIDGKAPRPGQVFSNPDLAATLQKLGKEGKDAFYKGEVAQKIVDAIQSRGGLMTLQDLADHKTDFTEPISYTYGKDGEDKVTVHECPPNGQGLAALIALGIIDVLREDGIVDFAKMEEGSVEWFHTLIEAIRLAFADVHAQIGDPSFVNVPVDYILSKDYLRQRARLFNPVSTAKVTAGLPPSSDTVYLTAADSEGNAISFIMSNYLGFGTAIVPNGCGFSLQSRGAAFSLDSKSPNVLEGGKRPFHTIIPAMVTRGDELFMSYGVMGGAMQPQGHVQVLLNLLHNGRQPQLALDAKRFLVGGTGLWQSKDPYYNTCVAIEDGVAEDVIAALEKIGHKVERVKGSDQIFFGKGQVILRTVDQRTGRTVWAAGSDYRGDGCAIAQF